MKQRIRICLLLVKRLNQKSKTIHQREVHDQMILLLNSTKHLNNNTNSIEEEETFANLFYDTNITLMLKPDQDTIKKVQTNISSEYRCTVLNKILSYQIQYHIKRIIYHDQVRFTMNIKKVQYQKSIQCSTLY